MAKQFNSAWRLAYPEHRRGAGSPSKVALTLETARAVKAHGGGSVAAGLARILCDPVVYASTLAYARAMQAQALYTTCPHCQRTIESDCALSHAKHRTTANPTGAYGCVHCSEPIEGYALPVTSDPERYRDPDRPPCNWQPTFHAVVRLPRRARTDLERIAPKHRTAWLALIQTWRELSFTPRTET